VRAVVPFSFGRVTLVPELPRFFARYPEIGLDISFSDEAVDLIAGGYDVAVRTGRIGDSRLTTRLLTRGPQVTFAAPAYLDRRGEPRTPQELRRHDCIVGRFGPEWSFRDADGAPFTVRVGGSLVIGSGDALREAAVAGVGIAQGTWWLVRKDLEAGALRPLLRDWAVTEGNPVSVLYPPQRHLPAKLRAFVDFLVEITRTA
jgi:DNA-binding transcriptional LysR family regulator